MTSQFLSVGTKAAHLLSITCVSFTLAVVGCAPSPPESTAGTSNAAIMSPAVEPREATPSQVEEDTTEQVKALEAEKKYDVANKDVEQMMGVLAPIDSPLPSRAALDANSNQPVAVLLAILADKATRPLERANAARLLGLYPEDTNARTELFARLKNPRLQSGQRVAAMEALRGWDLSADDEARRYVFEALDDQPGLQLAAVLIILDQGLGTERLSELLTDPDLHPSVRQELELRLTR